MPWWKAEDEPEYDSLYEENPIAKLYRREWENERMRLVLIDRLLGSLTAEDATRPLFTHAERREWGLKTYRRAR